MSAPKKAIVVGSGIAGLASAIRLAIAGFSVQVFEKNGYLGGKLTEMHKGNFRFDAGPSLFTMPHFVDELFELAEKKPSDYFQYVKSDLACNYFFEDGTCLAFKANKEELLKEIEVKLGVESSVVRKYFQRSEFIFNRTSKTFLEQSLHIPRNFLSKEIVKTVLAMPKLGLFTSMHLSNKRKLKHPKLVQIFNRFATYNGSNPYKAPAILNVIPHLEHGIGTFYPLKGMNGITESLTILAKELGVEFLLNQAVEEIVVENKKVKGIVSNCQFSPSDLVFCNADIRPAYQYLLKSEKISRKVLKQESSSSAMIFYWGMKKKFPELDFQNVFFSEDYKKEFEDIFTHQTVCSDPTVYIHISSKIKNDDAPDYGENWFVMINVPANSGQDWTSLRKEIRANSLTKLSRILKTDIESLIEEEDFLDPIRIEERTSSFGGALYGASSNDRMAAFFRHPNFSSVKGLHFVGGSVHPGGGIPLCLLSAKIAVETVKN